MPEIITRQEAIARGLARYFTGKPCKRGHIAERLLSGSACLECRKRPEFREYVKRWEAENPDKLRAKFARYDAANREARRLAAKARRDADPEKHRASVKAAYRRHRVETLERGRAYRAANPEKRLELSRAWHARNPEGRRVNENRRRARKKAVAGSFTQEQIQALVGRQAFRCAACSRSIKREFQIDHIEPLSRGGSNDITNIQLLCPSCNRRKSSKDPIAWAQENGKLL